MVIGSGTTATARNAATRPGRSAIYLTIRPPDRRNTRENSSGRLQAKYDRTIAGRLSTPQAIQRIDLAIDLHPHRQFAERIHGRI
jgi:hypothetical protein